MTFLVLFLFLSIPQVSYSCNVVSDVEASAEPEPQYAEDTLQGDYGIIKFSWLLFRHGERYRISGDPTDEHADFYENKWGELTKAGKKQIYELGRWTRARYRPTLLKETPYDSDILEAHSTGVNRAAMSAQLFLAGLYPPTTEDELWNENLKWQPIPIYSIPKKTDEEILQRRKSCPRFNQEILRITQTDEIKKFYEDHKWLFAHPEVAKTGKVNIENDVVRATFRMSCLNDKFTINERYNFSRPEWAKVISTDVFEKMTSMSLKFRTYNHTLKRLKGGPLVKRIVTDVVKRRDQPTFEKRIHILSAHDVTISMLLNTLGVFEPPQKPPYAAMVLIELREKFKDGKSEYYVTILYKTSTDEPPKLLEMPNCKNPCTLDEFVEVTKLVIPENHKRECARVEPDYSKIMF